MNRFRQDIKAAMNGDAVDTEKPTESTKNLYRVRKTWSDSKSQIGTYSSLENAKKACKEGYTVYDESDKAAYKVRVSIDDLISAQEQVLSVLQPAYIPVKVCLQSLKQMTAGVVSDPTAGFVLIMRKRFNT